MPWDRISGTSSAKGLSSRICGDSTKTALIASTDELVKCVVATRLLSRLLATSAGTFLRRAERSLALVTVMAESVLSVSISIKPNTALRELSPMLAPALLTTSYKAFNIAVLTPASVVLDPVTSSATKGSTRGVNLIKVPSALAARDRSTSLVVSASDLANVRWSCGKNGLRAVGIFSSRLLRVSRMAALTSVDLSETTRMSGPVI